MLYCFGAHASSKYSLLIKNFTLSLQRGDALSSHLNSMKSLLTLLASMNVNLDEDIVVAVLPKSLLDEDYNNVITLHSKERGRLAALPSLSSHWHHDCSPTSLFCGVVLLFGAIFVTASCNYPQQPRGD